MIDFHWHTFYSVKVSQVELEHDVPFDRKIQSHQYLFIHLGSDSTKFMVSTKTDEHMSCIMNLHKKRNNSQMLHFGEAFFGLEQQNICFLYM